MLYYVVMGHHFKVSNLTSSRLLNQASEVRHILGVTVQLGRSIRGSICLQAPVFSTAMPFCWGTSLQAYVTPSPPQTS